VSSVREVLNTFLETEIWYELFAKLGMNSVFPLSENNFLVSKEVIVLYLTEKLRVQSSHD